MGARLLKIDPAHISSGAERSGGASAEPLLGACCGNAKVDENESDVRAVSVWKRGGGRGVFTINCSGVATGLWVEGSDVISSCSRWRPIARRHDWQVQRDADGCKGGRSVSDVSDLESK